MSESDTFCWLNNEDICVPEQQPVAVYLNPAGDVVIRQPRGDMEEDDFVVVSPSNATRLLWALIDAAGLPYQLIEVLEKGGFADVERAPIRAASPGSAAPPRPKSDATAAERQKRYRERLRNGGSQGPTLPLVAE